MDYFQLYGNYNNEQLIDIRRKYKKKIITTIQVKNKEDVANYKKVEEGSDIILWDSTGYQESLGWDFNWIKAVSTNKEKMIAGNITIEKLNDLINLANIVDVSGALETNKVKDIDKIKKFINRIEQINNEN